MSQSEGCIPQHRLRIALILEINLHFVMWRTIIIASVGLGILTVLLQWLQYSFWLRTLNETTYIAILATMFTGLGAYFGIQFTKRRRIHVETINSERITELGISPREYEVLQLLDQGYSNQAIADTLFISLSTVKTHISKLYPKLAASSRTQAVQQARKLKIL